MRISTKYMQNKHEGNHAKDIRELLKTSNKEKILKVARGKEIAYGRMKIRMTTDSPSGHIVVLRVEATFQGWQDRAFSRSCHDNRDCLSPPSSCKSINHSSA